MSLEVESIVPPRPFEAAVPVARLPRNSEFSISNLARYIEMAPPFSARLIRKREE